MVAYLPWSTEGVSLSSGTSAAVTPKTLFSGSWTVELDRLLGDQVDVAAVDRDGGGAGDALELRAQGGVGLGLGGVGGEGAVEGVHCGDEQGLAVGHGAVTHDGSGGLGAGEEEGCC